MYNAKKKCSDNCGFVKVYDSQEPRSEGPNHPNQWVYCPVCGHHLVREGYSPF